MHLQLYGVLEVLSAKGLNPVTFKVQKKKKKICLQNFKIVLSKLSHIENSKTIGQTV